MSRTTILLLVLLPVLSAVGFYTGNVRGETNGRQAGYSQGLEEGAAKGYARAEKDMEFTKVSAIKYGELNDQYNDLVTDYNNLREAAIRYVGASSYQPRTPLSCTTNTFGNTFGTTYTNCY